VRAFAITLLRTVGSGNVATVHGHVCRRHMRRNLRSAFAGEGGRLMQSTFPSRSVLFFDEQFRRPPDDEALNLNPFEELALPHLRGDVLDFGCGLGNLAFAAARRGCRVTALDASTAAIEHVRRRAAAEAADVSAGLADLRDYELRQDYDAVVSIGLLMFFDCPTADRVLETDVALPFSDRLSISAARRRRPSGRLSRSRT
jgi:2-polyprenyl-3-methyl-5-hydroxy-6-metoxy-1,4-benzoquinol methylase